MDSTLVRAQRRLIAGLMFFAVLAIFPLTADPAIDIKVLAYELGAFAALVLWLLTPRRAPGGPRIASMLGPVLGVFAVLYISAAAVSPNVGYSLAREGLKLTALCILFVAAADVFHTPRSVLRLVAVLCVAVTLSSLYGILQWRGLDPFPWKDTTGMLRDAPATFGNPNLASHVLAPALILACGAAFLRGGRWVLLCLPLFLAQFALTQTRGSLLALAGAAVLVVVAIAARRASLRPGPTLALCLGAVVLAGAVGVVAAVLHARTTTGNPFPVGGGESITLRYHSFYGAARMIQDRPWRGHGTGMYEVLNPPYWTDFEQERFARRSMLNDHVHNEPLEFAVDAGIPAALAYLAFLLFGVYYGLVLGLTAADSERRTLGLTLAAFFLAFFIDGLFGFNFHAPVSALLLFILAGALAGLWRERHGPLPRAPRVPGRLAGAARIAAAVGALVLPVLAVRDFAAQFLHQRGRGALEHDAPVAAADLFARAATLAPYHWLHPYQQGVALLRLERPDEAARAFARTLELHPHYLVAQARRAEALFNVAAQTSGPAASAALDEAVACAEEALRSDPFLPEPHDVLGRVAFLRGQRRMADDPAAAHADFVEAEARLQRALDCGSKDKHKLYHMMALSRLARGDGRGAQKALVRSLDVKPDDRETWHLLQETARQTGRYDTLLACLELRRNGFYGTPSVTPEERALLSSMRAAALYEGYGDVDAAEDLFVAQVEERPEDAAVWAAFQGFAEAADRDEAFRARLVRAAADRDLPPPVRSVALAWAAGDEGVLAGAAELREAIDRDPDAAADPESVEAFAWAARALCAKAHESGLPPAKAGPLFLDLGLMLAACQDYEAAVRALEQALPRLSGDARVVCLLQRGEFLGRMGDTAAAVEAFEQAAALAPRSFEARRALARALAQAGHHDRARREYAALLERFELDDAIRTALLQEVESLPEAAPSH